MESPNTGDGPAPGWNRHAAHELHRRGAGGGGGESRSRSTWGPIFIRASPPLASPSAGTSQAGRWASGPTNGQWDGVSHKYTPPLRKHLLNGVQSYVFFADSNKRLIRTLLPAREAGESSGPTSSLRNSGCLLKAVPAPHSCRGGRLEGSGSLSSYRGIPAVLILASALSSPAFRMIYSA